MTDDKKTDDKKYDRDPESFFCPIGTELMLQFEELTDSRLRSSLVGIDREKYLIIRIPRAPGLEPFSLTGKNIKVIFLYDGTIYGFVSRILMSIMSPAPLFFVSCPQTMQKHELRKNLRIDCSIPVVIRERDKTDFTGVIADLSSGGCRVTVPYSPDISANIEIDKVFELSSEMLSIGRERPVRGVVRNLNQDEKRIHLGFQFENVDADMLERIQIYVNNVLGIIQ